MAEVKWQDLLDILTLKGTSTKVIFSIKSCEEGDKFKLCYEENRIFLHEWLASNVKAEIKSAAESVKYRLAGNEMFIKRKDEDALKMYNLSVTFAPYNTNEFALALANRSAVLKRLNYFEEAVQDIDLALEHDNGEVSQMKVLVRKAQLLNNLNKPLECLEVIRSIFKHVGGMDKCDNEELKKLYLKLFGTPKKETSVQEETLPSPIGGENTSFSSASSHVSLRWSEQKGRHVMAKKDLGVADIIFVEKPFALVVLPDQYDRHCHHCCKFSVSLIPCRACVTAQFCSNMCRVAAWGLYHRWECGGLQICHSVGIAHLGLRLALMADDSERYKQVSELVTHMDNMNNEDLYQYAITATLLTLYLEEYTTFFQDCSIPVMAMGSRILRHIAQLICNGHAITKIDSGVREKGFANTLTEAQVRIATAIYPSASMMNHSCDHNISNDFINQVLVVRASKPIKEGEEVFNCYGPHYTRMDKEERQTLLRDQYFFTCQCPRCTEFSEAELLVFSAFLCFDCGGPVVKDTKECSKCGKPQKLEKLVKLALAAHDSFLHGKNLLERGELEDSFTILDRAVFLAKQCLYKHHSDLSMYKDSLARVHAEMGNYKEAMEIVKDCMISVEKQFGPSSVELSRELLKYRDLLCRQLAQLISEKKDDSPEYFSLQQKMEKTLRRLHEIVETNVDARFMREFCLNR